MVLLSPIPYPLAVTDTKTSLLPVAVAVPAPTPVAALGTIQRDAVAEVPEPSPEAVL